MHDQSISHANERYKRAGLMPFFVISFLILTASLSLLMMTKPNSVLAMRSYFSDHISQMVERLDRWATYGSDVLYSITHFLQREQEIQKLTTEKEELVKWRHLATKLYAENDSLKKLLQGLPEERHDMVTARCITLSQDVIKTALINVGTQHHVTEGDLVLGKYGVVGRVIESAPTSSRVLLIIDPTSKMPVHVEGKNIPALVVGDYSGKLKLQYVPQASPLTVGDRLVTSNEGDIVPTGFYVGVIHSIRGEDIEVIPAENSFDIDYVIVLRK